MDRVGLLALMNPDALRHLDHLAASAVVPDAFHAVNRMRSAGLPADTVAAIASQARLRRRARTKFGDFADRMLFTEAGLEQSSRMQLGAVHASRFLKAGCNRVADLGCGIGGDALAMTAAGLAVLAVEADEVTAAIAAYNLRVFPEVEVVCGDAEGVELEPGDGVWVDPSRRKAGEISAPRRRATRLKNIDEYSPSLGFALGLGRERPVGVKLGPGDDRQAVLAAAAEVGDFEAQWVSVDGSVLELLLWFGTTARQGVGRSALVMRWGRAHERAAVGDAADEPVGKLGSYLYEPDGAVIRARLVGDLVREVDGAMLSPGIAYFSSDRAAASPFFQGFRVVELLPFDTKAIRGELVRRGVGNLEIKKRGVQVDPAAYRRELRLRGDNAATLVLTRVAGKHAAILVERME